LAELDLIKKDILSNAYPEKVIESVINKKPQLRKQKCNDSKSICMVSVPYIKGLSEKFKRIGNRFSINTVYKTKNTIGSLMKNQTKDGVKRDNHSVYLEYHTHMVENVLVGQADH
jgi:hypothetical protein